MKTKCYSVRLESLVPITAACYKARSFDGSEDLIPASQIFGKDFDVQKSDAYWISAWILGKKNLQYSTRKEAWFDEHGRQLPTITVHKHTPKPIDKINVKPIKSLIR
jgi:hypothetical protein